MLRAEADSERSARPVRYDFTPSPALAGVTATNAAQHLSIELERGRLGLHSTAAQGWKADVRWVGLGRGAAVQPIPLAASPVVFAGPRASYRRELGEEWFVNGAHGLEQGFVLSAPPSGPRMEPVTIDVLVDGDLKPNLRSARDVVLMSGSGAAVARWSHLAVFDAFGARVRAWFEVRGRYVAIRIEDGSAEYPLRVDPTWTQEAVLLPSDPQANQNFAGQLGLHGDMAIVSANGAGGPPAGAAYVFSRTGGIWNQVQKVTPTDGNADDGFEPASFDADTLIAADAPAFIGEPSPSGEAAYFFQRLGGAWVQQQKIPGLSGGPISGDTAVLSGWDADAGFGGTPALYAYTRQCGVWSLQQQLPLTSRAVVSGAEIDGETVVVGQDSDLVGGVSAAGSVSIFARSGGTWSLQQVLTASDAVTDGAFGTIVAISGDTIAVGADDTTSGLPGAYIYTRTGTTWTLQQELTGILAAALNKDTLVAITPVPHEAGTVDVYRRNGTVWSHVQALTPESPPNPAYFGQAIAVDGNTILVGAGYTQPGIAYVFTTGSPAGASCTQDSDCADYHCVASVCCDSCADAGAPLTGGGGCPGAGGASTASSTATTAGATGSSSTSATSGASSSGHASGAGGGIPITTSRVGDCGCRAAGQEDEHGDRTAAALAAGLALLGARRSRRHGADARVRD